MDFSAITAPAPFADDIVLSSKQAGALAQTIFFGQTGGKIKIGEKELSVRLVQTDFANVSDDGSADFNVVANVNLRPFKDEMNAFPFSLFKKYSIFLGLALINARFFFSVFSLALERFLPLW